MPETPSLKTREIQILRLIADGMSDRDIATRLSLKAETVRWYNKQVYAKLGVTNRTQAVRRAAALGILDVPVSAASLNRNASPAKESTAASIERSPVQYVSREGVHIAYQTIGSGNVDVLIVNGFISHIELSWDDAEYTAFVESLARDARVIVFDKRGIGLSDRTAGGPTLEETVDDMRAVLDAVGAARPFIFGTSEGGAACIVFALKYPDRVRGMVLCNATARVARSDNDPDWARHVDDFNKNIQLLIGAWGQPWAVDRFAPSRMRDQQFRERWARIMRSSSSPSSIRSVLEIARDIDVSALLPQVRVRTLVLHRGGDRVVDVNAGRFLAARIQDARFVALAGEDHVYFVNGEETLREVREFLAEHDEPVIAESTLATILHVAERGPLAVEKRVAVNESRGQHLRLTPVGWTVLFDSPRRAIDCARRLRALGRGRIGGIALHVGACRTSDGVPVGLAHEVAQQLADLAHAGDVIVSDTLRDILAGSGVSLERFTPKVHSGDTPIAFGWRLID